MPPVEILEQVAPSGHSVYRALHNQHEAVADTPGQALDALRATLQLETQSEQPLVVLLQRRAPDRFFSVAQRARLEELMGQFHDALDRGESLPEQDRRELEALVDAELGASASRAATLAEVIGR
jgi:hypothetical protein